MNSSVEKLPRALGGTVLNVHLFKLFSILIWVSLSSSFGLAVQERSILHRLYGDVKVEGHPVDGVIHISRNPSFDVILYSLSGSVLGRQSVRNRGRYQFVNVPDGQYELAIEFQNQEIGRMRVRILAAFDTDFVQDIELEWKSAGISRKPAAVSVDDFYVRSEANQKQFEKAQHAIDEKRYMEATTLLKRILADDPNDFQSWTELGTVYLAQSAWAVAETSYVRATEVRPGFFLGLLNLGRLRIMRKDFVGAIPVLVWAVETKPDSADANYYLGETYLQVKKGSKAVNYLYEAIRLDPIGKAQAHLRLATLYNAVGLKDKAAIEYQEFLKKQPYYYDRKRLEKYINANLSSVR